MHHTACQGNAAYVHCQYPSSRSNNKKFVDVQVLHNVVQYWLVGCSILFLHVRRYFVVEMTDLHGVNGLHAV